MIQTGKGNHINTSPLKIYSLYRITNGLTKIFSISEPFGKGLFEIGLTFPPATQRMEKGDERTLPVRPGSRRFSGKDGPFDMLRAKLEIG
jgi:hypothetical protein